MKASGKYLYIKDDIPTSTEKMSITYTNMTGGGVISSSTGEFPHIYFDGNFDNLYNSGDYVYGPSHASSPITGGCTIWYPENYGNNNQQPIGLFRTKVLSATSSTGYTSNECSDANKFDYKFSSGALGEIPYSQYYMAIPLASLTKNQQQELWVQMDSREGVKFHIKLNQQGSP